MTTEARPSLPGIEPIEPHADFPIVDVSRRPMRVYSLVYVPTGIPFYISYRKNGILDFVIKPTTDVSSWTLEGQIDTDIVKILDLPVTNIRHRDNPPVVTGEELDKFKDWGKVEPTDSFHFTVRLWLPTHSIHTLLNSIWQAPDIGNQHYKSLVPEGNRNYRILPQKQSLLPKDAQLIVARERPTAPIE